MFRILFLILCILTLNIGCTPVTEVENFDTPAPTATQPPTPTPVETQELSEVQVQEQDAAIGEAAYLLTVRNAIPEYASAPDHRIIELGHQGCDLIDTILLEFEPRNGEEFFAAMALLAIDIGLAEDELGRMAMIMGAATPVYCPEHASFLSN